MSVHVRTSGILRVSATLLSLSIGGIASAQQPIGSVGQQIERQVRGTLGSMIAGPQPYNYQSSYYGPTQPYAGPYQRPLGGYGTPGYQSPLGGVYGNAVTAPYWRSGQVYSPYARPLTQPGYYDSQGRYVLTQPTYDRQVQPTTYTVSPAAPLQRYQIPAQYAGTPAGYVITYGGRTYLSGSDGTMTLYSRPVSR